MLRPVIPDPRTDRGHWATPTRPTPLEGVRRPTAWFWRPAGRPALGLTPGSDCGPSSNRQACDGSSRPAARPRPASPFSLWMEARHQRCCVARTSTRRPPLGDQRTPQAARAACLAACRWAPGGRDPRPGRAVLAVEHNVAWRHPCTIRRSRNSHSRLLELLARRRRDRPVGVIHNLADPAVSRGAGCHRGAAVSGPFRWSGPRAPTPWRAPVRVVFPGPSGGSDAAR